MQHFFNSRMTHLDPELTNLLIQTLNYTINTKHKSNNYTAQIEDIFNKIKRKVASTDGT